MMKMLSVIRPLFMICAMLYLSQAHALKGVTKVTEVEGISEYRLKNGMTVLLFPDPTKETVTVNVTYKVGSKHENYGETGMAHLLEHLLFKGSKKHKDIPAELSRHGAKPNGTTWIDRTNYFETFAATEENIDWALSLESDRMVNSFIAKKDLDSEMTVVSNEFERGENSPMRVLMMRMMSAAYMWHNNGKPTIGALSDIENVSIERLRAFYKKYYQPDNAVLTVAGKFDSEVMLKKIKNTFGKIKKPKRKLEPLYTVEPAQDGEKRVVVRRVGDIQWYAAAYHIPAGGHEDYAPVEVLMQVLGDTPRGRLHKNVVEKKLAVSAFAYPFQLNEPGLAFIATKVEKDGDVELVKEAFLNTVENYKKAPITEEEVELAKKNILKNFELAFNSSERIAILLSEYIGMGDWRLLFLTRDRIENVTAEDVQRVAEKYFVQNNRTEGVFVPTENPQRVEIPKIENLASMLDGYKGREQVAQGEAFDPSFDNIDERTKTVKLANGIQLAMLPKKTRGESVSVSLELQFGNEQSLQNMSFAAEGAAAMLMRGTTKYSREALQNKLDTIKTNMRVGGSVNAASASLVTNKQNLPAALDLMAHVLKNPSFDKKEAELFRDEAVANLQASKQEPQSIVFREMKRFYYYFDEGHPLYFPSVEEAIDGYTNLKTEDVQKFYELFYAANSMQISVVGDFDPKEVESLLKENFSGWRSDKEFKIIEYLYKNLKPVDITIDTPDKENAAMVAMLPLPVGINHEDAAALSLGSYIFGGGFLNSRLATRLRQKEGMSYGAGAWLQLSHIQERGEFNAYAIFSPNNMERVELAIREELQKVLDDGFTNEEIEAAKSGIKQKSRVERAQDGTLASQLRSNLFFDRTMQWHKNYENAVQGLSAEQVHKAFKRYIDVNKLSFVRAGDLSKAKQAE